MQSSTPQRSAPSLRSWITTQYQSFHHDLEAGNLKNWVVCVGNEAGDLDTIASSIAFAYFNSSLHPLVGITDKQYIPVQQTKSIDFKLRPENVQVLKSIDLLDETQSLPMMELICSDGIDFTKLTSYGAKFALLDHNQINKSIFGELAEVVAIIDHHQAEAGNTLYLNANPRLIQVPTGSCASLVTTYFSSIYSSLEIPSTLADLLLSAIAIDTHNFKRVDKDDKTTDTDMAAREWLWSRSRFSSTNSISTFSRDSEFSKYFKEIKKFKNDISNLNSDQLLRRDYKQYNIHDWSVGISSVPITLETWIGGERCNGDWNQFLDVLKQHSITQKLDITYLLTDLPKPKKFKPDPNQPKLGRRHIALATKAPLSHIINLLIQQHSSIQLDPLINFISPQIQGLSSIHTWSNQNQASVIVLKADYPFVSRKQVAPALVTLIEKLGSKVTVKPSL